MKRFLVIDAFGIIYRYYYIFIKNPLQTKDGENTSAIFGFLRTYFSLIETYPSDYVCVALDATRETFRTEIYPEYKANRDHMPEDLQSQIPHLMTLLDALAIPKVSLTGYEADDIIGYIARKNRETGVRTLIYSPDKDIMQLVDKNTTIIASDRKGKLLSYDEEGVTEKRGVPPSRIVDLLALMGDQADNIPGVKGVGEKTALKLLDAYGSLDGIYENIELVKGKLQEKLIADKENAYISKTLATIKDDFDFPFSYDAFTPKAPDLETTRDLLQRLELHQIQKQVDDVFGEGSGGVRTATDVEEKALEPEAERAQTPATYHLVETEDALDELLARVEKEQLVSVDFETTGLNPFTDRIIGVAFALQPNEAFYLDVAGRTELSFDETLAKVFKTLSKESVRVIGQNLKYEYKMAARAGFSFGNLYFDTMLASYVLHPSQRSHNMDATAKEYLDYTTVKYADVTDNGKKTLLDVDLDVVTRYAAEDADITFRLYNYLSEALTREGLDDLFFSLEMPLVPVLGDMELAGVRLDTAHFEALSTRYAKALGEAETKIYAEAGGEFNIASPKQVAETLFTKMGIKPTKKTKTGFSTDESVLHDLAKRHAIARHILEYRKYAKWKNTYIDVLPKLIQEETGRIHSHFNQTVTATGRLSSSEPNLQNIPVREEGREIRQGIVPEEGNVLISADYSQVERRLLAHYSEDPILVKAFHEDEDIHKKTAMKIYSVSEAHVTHSMRNVAKIINFSIIYGKTAFGLSKELDISRKEAESFIESYFKMYEGVKAFKDRTINEAREKGYVTTIKGRKRDVAIISSRNANLRREGERIAVNTVIQGSAADLIKIAMRGVDRILKKEYPLARTLMQVHDELVIEAPYDDGGRVKDVVASVMEDALSLRVPLRVDVNAGMNWGDIH